MKYLRNQDVLREILVSFVIGVICSLVTYPAIGGYAILFLLLAFVLVAVHYYFSIKRYQQIAQLSLSLDKVLHGNAIQIDDQYEGELSILSDEISKMIIKLNEQTELLQKDKVRLTNAIADIFHQMRTPLTSINLSLIVLNDEHLSNDKALYYRRDIKKQLEKLQWLIETLLKMSKIDAKTAIFHRREILAKDILTKAIEPFAIPMELKEQKCVLNCSNEKMFVDEQWTMEAFSNLIKNAMEHTPDGGTIQLNVSENPLYTEVIVQDNGEGIPEEDIPYMFERFYKGRNAKPESVGIGLAFARMIITAQNGTISVKNNQDGGACFSVRFYKQII
ncbi:HAMP domain-containing sensor histidine kinase [uncultured Solobacterium sp.]|uniref:sensor histidine kinase n=1 Tax=uncultured Solobacterium sp. TaxID=747375 RepID=UPI0028DCEBCE|nr:HAMP domain-containing sensor histidine kinase [uncultured Solobacterium sp.]